MKEFKMDKFWSAITFSVLITALIAVLDIASMKSGIFAQTPTDYMMGNFDSTAWWNLFKGIAITAMALFGLAYYFLVKKDKSEAVGVSIVSYVLWRAGFSDILYFFFQGKMVPPEVTWLNNIVPFSWFAQQGVVTNISLYLSVFFGVIIAIGIAWILRRKF